MSDLEVGDWATTLPFKIPFILADLIATPRIRASDKEPGEEHLAFLSADETLSLSIADAFSEAAERALVEHRFAANEELRAAADRRFQESSLKKDAIMAIFWVMLKDNHDLWGQSGALAVRAGGEIVSSPSDRSEDPILEFLRQRGLRGPMG
ncbi:hypothetical protein A3A70_00025 [candidate division WWE3 bacterium RIFCSPLOWO2_01_FULL_42_11]|uniref:Uncharacterized protein n=1 Tax=candidate division WWE3 bacterium RIFCSPLOWO2_01_FULL_42_11 TaxID=1802627 RepID=A0A1F4VQ56_UNCKA|nr:MAG: hypothetical protein A3A70_00025 [candidate division WWE3 bacterium RIFCSPLOWO2_01_FULL_42_11]